MSIKMLPSSMVMAEILGNHTKIKIEEETKSSTNEEERRDKSPWFRRECEENKFRGENESETGYETSVNRKTLEKS
jgi:hypothetical protein